MHFFLKYQPYGNQGGRWNIVLHFRRWPCMWRFVTQHLFCNICCIKNYTIDLQLKKLQQIDNLIYESDKYGHLFRMDGHGFAWKCQRGVDYKLKLIIKKILYTSEDGCQMWQFINIFVCLLLMSSFSYKNICTAEFSFNLSWKTSFMNRSLFQC